MKGWSLSIMKKFILNSLSVLFTALLVSCSNFTDSSRLKKIIEEKIEYERAESCLVKIAAEKGTGITTPNTEEKKKPTDYFNIDFDINEAYWFSKWVAVDYKTEEPLTEAVSFEPADAFQTKATILDSKKDIWIKPLCYKIGTTNILITSENGYTSPAGSEEYRTGSTYDISFSEDAEYCFIEWRVIDLNKITDNIIPDEKYIRFENKNSYNTTFTLLGIPEEDDNVALSIQPYCVLRPKVVSHTPTYESNGVIRNTRIRVLFSQNMNEESIYFTEKEMESLQNLNPGIRIIRHEATRNSSKSGDKFYYGYTLNGQTYFKNISITELSDSDTSLCNYFSEPYFANKRSLIIPTKKGIDAPPEATDIMVDISKKMVADQYGFNVSLKEGDSWQYLVNEDVDNIKPEFKSLTITDSAQTANQSAFPSCETIKNAFSLTNLRYSKNHKFLVNAEIYDKSGISELYIEMQKILGATYKAGDQLLTDEPVAVYQVPLKVIGDTAKCKDTEIDLSDYADGVYKMTFKTSDNSGIETVYGTPFYITKDYTPVAISTLKLQVNNTNGTVNLDPSKICPTPYSSSNANYSDCYSEDGFIKVTGTLPLQNESDVESIEVKAFKYSSELFDTAAGAMNQPVGTYNIDFTQTEAEYKISDFNIDLSPYGNGLYRLEVLVKDKDGNIASSTVNAVLESLAEVEFAGPEFFGTSVLNTYKLKTGASPFQKITIKHRTLNSSASTDYESIISGPVEKGTILNETSRETSWTSYYFPTGVSSGGKVQSVCTTQLYLPASPKTIANTTVLPPAIISFSKDSAIEIKFHNSTSSSNIIYDYVDLYLDDSTEPAVRLTPENNTYTITGLTNGKKYKITSVSHSDEIEEDFFVVPSVIYETPSPYPLDGHVLYEDYTYSSSFYLLNKLGNKFYDAPTPVGMVYDVNSVTKMAKLMILPDYFENLAYANKSYRKESNYNSILNNSYYIWDTALIYKKPDKDDYLLTEVIPAAAFVNYGKKYRIDSTGAYLSGTHWYPKVPANIAAEGPNGTNWYIPSIEELQNLADNYGEKLDDLVKGTSLTGCYVPDYKTRFWSSSTDTSKKSRYGSYVDATTNAYYYDFSKRNVFPQSCDKETTLSVLYIVNIDLSKF